jgi:hypothetical protein
MGIREVVIPTLFCLCCFAAENPVTSRTPSQTLAHVERIPLDTLRADLDYLFRTISEVHPNMYAYTNAEKYAMIKDALYGYVDHAMTTSEFYVCVQPVVYYLRDSHTMVYRPPNFVMPPITGSMRELGVRLKEILKDDEAPKTDTQYVSAPRKKEYAGPYSYHLLPEYDTCLMVLDSFGKPDEIEQYTKKFQEAFKAIKDKGAAHLVIDVRENRGGSGLVGDELLKHLAKKPFRQIEKVEQRIVPAFFVLCERYGLDANKTMLDEYGIDLEGLKSKGRYKAGMIATGQAPFKNPHKPSERFKGSVYLLIGKPTFSSASNFAAAVKYFQMGTLIGQETSGTRDHYGQVLPVELPHSGLKGQVSTAHFLAVGGTEDPAGVKPDCEVRQKPEDTVRGIDTALEFTLNLIRNGGTVSGTQSVN